MVSSVTYSAESRTQNTYATPVSYNRWLGIRIACIRPCPEGGPCEQPLPFGQYKRQLGQTRCLSTAARMYRPRMGLDCAQGLVWFAHTPASPFCCRDLLAICSWTHLIMAVVPLPYHTWLWCLHPVYHTWLWHAWPSENPLHSIALQEFFAIVLTWVVRGHQRARTCPLPLRQCSSSTGVPGRSLRCSGPSARQHTSCAAWCPP